MYDTNGFDIFRPISEKVWYVDDIDRGALCDVMSHINYRRVFITIFVKRYEFTRPRFCMWVLETWYDSLTRRGYNAQELDFLEPEIYDQLFDNWFTGLIDY